jgi:nitrite reductase (NADH) small subunit
MWRAEASFGEEKAVASYRTPKAALSRSKKIVPEPLQSHRGAEKGKRMAFVRAMKIGELPPGMVRELQLDGKVIALSNVGGKLYAIDNVCLHRGGPLGEGELSGQVVTCPWHGWQYDVTSGKLVTNPAVGVETYPVELRGDDVYVDVG